MALAGSAFAIGVLAQTPAPQKIEQFERVVVRGGIPQDLRREP